MRNEVIHYIKDLSRTIQFPTPVIDFGGIVVDGQEQFTGLIKQIVGPDYQIFDLDSRADICGDIHSTQLQNDSIGTALLLETLEHLAYPQTAFTELFRILKPSGLLIVTTLMCWGEHRFPYDYWRFLPDGINHLFTSTGFRTLGITTEGPADKPSGIFAYGVKP